MRLNHQLKASVLFMTFFVGFICCSCSCDRGIDLSGDGGGDGDAYGTDMEITGEDSGDPGVEQEEEEAAPDVVEVTGEDMGPPRYWSKQLDSPDCWVTITIPMHDGGYLAAGSPRGMGLVKLDDRGNVTWSRAYHVRYYENFISLVETPEGDFFALCDVDNDPAYPDELNADLWVLRLDYRGEIIWQKILGGPASDFGMDMLLTREGDLLVCGSIGGFSIGYFDAWLLRLDPGGGVIWQKRYGGEGEDRAEAILQGEDGGFWVLGETSSLSGGYPEPWIMKLDADGRIVQQIVLQGPEDRIEYSMGGLAPAPDGGIVFSGSMRPRGSGAGGVLAMRLDGAGNIVWKKKYGTFSDYFGIITTDVDGGFVMAGSSSSFGEETDGVILKLDPDGDILWQRSYGGPGSDSIDSVRTTTDGGYIVGASSFFFYHKTWIMKVNDLGLIPGDCPAGIGAETSFEVSTADFTPAETDAVPIETDIVPADTAAIPTDPGSVEFETQCVGW